MTSSRSTLCTEHRLARLIAWTRLALVWIAALMFNDGFRPNSRRLEIFGGLSLQRLARMVRNLIIIRALQMPLASRCKAPRRDFTPAGFRRRLRPRQMLRSVAGSRLRRALRARSAGELISVLINALRTIDKLAQSIVRYLTRLAPLLVAEPPRAALRTRAAPTPCGADSS